MPKYYVGNLSFGQNDLAHFGIPKMRWGVRRWQNYDGTLTPEGRERYGKRAKDRGSMRLRAQSLRNIAKGKTPSWDKAEREHKNDKNRYESLRAHAEARLRDMGYEPTREDIDYLANQGWFDDQVFRNVPYKDPLARAWYNVSTFVMPYGLGSVPKYYEFGETPQGIPIWMTKNKAIYPSDFLSKKK